MVNFRFTKFFVFGSKYQNLRKEFLDFDSFIDEKIKSYNEISDRLPI